MLLGSVSHGLIHHATCPLVVVPGGAHLKVGWAPRGGAAESGGRGRDLESGHGRHSMRPPPGRNAP
ncbi:hypothetical protein ACU686_09320 [Yinghuangia aomiensis]